MISMALALALLLQAAPKASVSGTVVHSATGEPMAGVSVTIARTDAPLGAFGQMVAGDHPPAEMTITSDLLAMLSDELTAAARDGNGPSGGGAREALAMAALPVADIHSIVASPDGAIGVIYKSAPPMVTDSQGRFSFGGLDPGTYKLIFKSNGFARQDYGQRSTVGTGIPLVLAGGQSKNDIVMRMVPVSAVAGHVTDKAGQPLAAVPVQLFRFVFDENGKKKMQRAASAQTDDRGEYRIFYLSPGRYFLSAGNPPGQQNRPQGAVLPAELALVGASNYVSTNRINENYAISYFPGVGDENAATAIDIPPGADVGGIDLSLNVQQSYRVRGRVIDPRTSQPPPSANVSLEVIRTDVVDELFGGGGFVDYGSGSPIYYPADGTFDLKNVVPGAYRLSVTLPSPPTPRPPDFANMSPAERDAFFATVATADRVTPRAVTIVKVVNSDVEGIALTVGMTGAIPGRIRMEPGAAVLLPSMDFLRIQMKSTTDIGQNGDGPQQVQPIKDDGQFRIDNVLPGDYRLVVVGLPEGFYLKEARSGETDLLNGTLRFAGGSLGPLDLVISTRVAQVDGTVADTRAQAAQGAHVVLIPDSNRNRTELFRPVLSDATGHFAISNVTPGDYRLVAWEFLEPFAFFDSRLILQAEESGTRIHIAESSKQTIDLKALPSPGN